MAYKVFTLKEFYALGMDAPFTGPFALENRKAKDLGGTGNYYSTRLEYQNNILGGVIHITAGISDYTGPDSSAENTVNYGRTTARDASWTAIVDSDSIINCLHPNRTAWCQGVRGYNFNKPLLGVEIGQKNTNWHELPPDWVKNTLDRLAAYYAPLALKYHWPLRVITDRNQVQRLVQSKQKVGFTEHWRLEPERRGDAGRVGNKTTFPWDTFFHKLEVRMDQLTGKPAAVPAAPVTSGPRPTLVLGNRGAVVKRLQEDALRIFPSYAGTIKATGGADGVYGGGTVAFVKEFQHRVGLTDDGVVGPKTWAKLIENGFRG